MNGDNPLISVVTVAYNAVATIEKTIVSVINQTYPNIEYIIIDGGSTDGTVDVIKKYADRLAYWVSEPDKGIYDAMNKGAKIATGKWINFMNCGDSFYSKVVLMNIFGGGKVKDCVDVIYGDTCVVEVWGRYEQRPTELSNMMRYKPFCHQSSFVRSTLMKKNLFDTTFHICADYHFFHTLWQRNVCFLYVPITISVFDQSAGSLSGNNKSEAYYEDLLVSGSSYIYARFARFWVRYWLGKLFHFLVPKSVVVKRRRLRIERNSDTKSIYWD